MLIHGKDGYVMVQLLGSDSCLPCLLWGKVLCIKHLSLPTLILALYCQHTVIEHLHEQQVYHVSMEHSHIVTGLAGSAHASGVNKYRHLCDAPQLRVKCLYD